MHDTDDVDDTACIFCGGPNMPERVEAGIQHCKAKACVAAHLQPRAANLRLDLVPKVGFAYSFRDDPVAATIGRSSGRSI